MNDLGRKVLQDDLLPLPKQNRAFHRPLQLPNISGPIISFERFEGIGSYSRDLSFAVEGRPTDKMHRQNLDILAALAKRRTHNRNHFKPVIEILAEFAFL